MIKAKHHSIIYPLFRWLIRVLIKWDFYSIHIESEFDDNGQAVMVIANHISWWDGFWVEYLNQKMIRRKMYFMMLKEQLRKHWYFQYIGGYSVKKKSREIFESIDYTIELLKKKDSLVLIFPQGKIHSSHIHAVQFENGIQQIIKQCTDETQVLFMVNLTDYFSNAKPHLFMYTEKYSVGFLKTRNIEEEYNLFYSKVLARHNTKTS